MLGHAAVGFAAPHPPLLGGCCSLMLAALLRVSLCWQQAFMRTMPCVSEDADAGMPLRSFYVHCCSARPALCRHPVPLFLITLA